MSDAADLQNTRAECKRHSCATGALNTVARETAVVSECQKDHTSDVNVLSTAERASLWFERCTRCQTQFCKTCWDFIPLGVFVDEHGQEFVCNQCLEKSEATKKRTE